MTEAAGWVGEPGTLPARPGTWFALRTRNAYVSGVLVQVGQRGFAVGYFFGPARANLPSLADVRTHRPGDAALIARFNLLRLGTDLWPVIGAAADWDAAAWPVPHFGYHDESVEKFYEITLHAKEPGRVAERVVVDEGRYQELPQFDGLVDEKVRAALGVPSADT